MTIRSQLLLPLLTGAISVAATVHAQGVAINTTGAAADASAMLDISSTQRGFLPPRMTAAQRAAIVSPATGLLVYQSDGTVGLYYNAGTPAVPNWVLAGPGQGAGVGQWTVSGSNLYYTAGKIAVGTTPSGYGITLSDPNNGLRVATANTGGSLASFGGVGVFDVDAPFIPGGRLRLTESGMLGIGNTAPTAPLSFANGYGKKISLSHASVPLPGLSGDYGLGVVSGQTQVFGAGTGAGVGLGYDDNGTFVEKLGVRSTGALAVGGNEGTAGQVLTSGGVGAPATWASPTSRSYDDTWIVDHLAQMQTLTTSATSVEGMTQGITVPAGAKVLVSFALQLMGDNCPLCPPASVEIEIDVDGVSTRTHYFHVGSNEFETASATQALSLSAGVHTISLSADVVGANTGVSLGALYPGNSNQMIIQMVRP